MSEKVKIGLLNAAYIIVSGVAFYTSWDAAKAAGVGNVLWWPSIQAALGFFVSLGATAVIASRPTEVTKPPVPKSPYSSR